jgi:hypothetical protein
MIFEVFKVRHLHHLSHAIAQTPISYPGGPGSIPGVIVSVGFLVDKVSWEDFLQVLRFYLPILTPLTLRINSSFYH